MVDPIAIVHLCCYLIALIPAVYIVLQIDYPKFIKAKSNLTYYFAAALIGMGLTYLAGEFIFNLITMFIK